MKLLDAEKITFKVQYYFDSKSHFFCEAVKGFEGERRRPSVSYQRYFESFEEFAKYRSGDLRGVDLSNALELDVDF